MNRMIRSLSLALVFALATSGLRAGGADAQQLATQARIVLKQFCQRCHHGEGSEGGDFDVLRDKTMTAARGDKKPLVIPGDLAKSVLLRKMQKGLKGELGQMPPKEVVRERPTAADVEAVQQWIAAGSPAFPAAETRPFLGTQAVLTAVRDHLASAHAVDRPYLRYFTLTHLHNNPKVPDGDLRVYRAALSKALNSLSWKQAPVIPQAVDREQTVFVVDVRKLDWDRHNLWQEVMKAYPFGLKYRNHPNPALQRLDADISAMTDCELPYVRADWFIATATRPPLYHTLLQLPNNAGDLERALHVNIKANFLRDELLRGGFAASGVSGQNRLVERHEAAFGSYWKSYDFKLENKRNRLMEFPLGPKFQGNPFLRQAFDHDGGEIIFNLPNGLQGYLLVDGKDKRIDAGPVAVVSDALKTSGTAEIVSGVSCMACHKFGMIGFKDQVRDGKAVFDEARDKVLRLYPEQKVIDERVKEDTDRFLRALEKTTIGPFLRGADDKDRDIHDFAEPIGEIARLYRLVDLDLAAVALELDLEKPEQLKAVIAVNKRLQAWGLAPLLQEGGLIKRQDWEKIGATSLMQRVARELDRGTPFRLVN